MEAAVVFRNWSVGLLSGVALTAALMQPAHAGGMANAINNSDRQSQDQDQAQGQTQTATGGTATVGGDINAQSAAQSVTVEAKRQSPGFAISASGPCTGAGVTGSFLGNGAGVVTVDQECSKREAARLAALLGHDDLAARLLMDLDAVKDLDKPKPVEVNAHGWEVKEK